MGRAQIKAWDRWQLGGRVVAQSCGCRSLAYGETSRQVAVCRVHRGHRGSDLIPWAPVPS